MKTEQHPEQSMQWSARQRLGAEYLLMGGASLVGRSVLTGTALQ
jgi:hypothetical protein